MYSRGAAGASAICYRKVLTNPADSLNCAACFETTPSFGIPVRPKRARINNFGNKVVDESRKAGIIGGSLHWNGLRAGSLKHQHPRQRDVDGLKGLAIMAGSLQRKAFGLAAEAATFSETRC
jgi:hypothetical protein